MANASSRHVSALSGGNYNGGGGFNNAGNNGNCWTATENNADNAYSRNMAYDYDVVGENYNGKSYGYSVRCRRDCAGGGRSSAFPLFLELRGSRVVFSSGADLLLSLSRMSVTSIFF
jgi:hypothetical protein